MFIHLTYKYICLFLVVKGRQMAKLKVKINTSMENQALSLYTSWNPIENYIELKDKIKKMYVY